MPLVRASATSVTFWPAYGVSAPVTLKLFCAQPDVALRLQRLTTRSMTEPPEVVNSTYSVCVHCEAVTWVLMLYQKLNVRVVMEVGTVKVWDKRSRHDW